MPSPPLLIPGSNMGSFLSQPPPPPLKRSRAASAPCENEEARQRKRSKGNLASSIMNEKILEQSEDEECRDIQLIVRESKGKEKEPSPADSHAVVARGVAVSVLEDLAQELKCGCCTELCYHPVIVNPCQHFFCGSCCILWVRNGGTNCPACRGVSTSVTPSRVLQSMIDLLLRSDPSKARTDNERMQADQIYRVGTSLRLPTPRPATPNLEPPNDNFARPCPTCLAGNAYGWRCPVPIQDPAVDPENAFDLDDGAPAGHTFCGNCDQLHGVQAPTTTKCDFCQVSFCGIGVQGRCCALGLLSQHPHGMADLPDIILSGAIYENFQGNSVEVDILVDYLRANDIALRGVYKEIVTYTLQQPNPFMSLIDTGVFDDLHGVSGGEDPDPTAPRRRICRLCAAQVLIYGLKDWWVRERGHGNLPADVAARKDCAQGSGCDKQSDPAHCKEFNHIISPPVLLAPASNPPAPGPNDAAHAPNMSTYVSAARLGLLFFPANDNDAPPPPSPPSPSSQLSPSLLPSNLSQHMDVDASTAPGPSRDVRSDGIHANGADYSTHAAGPRIPPPIPGPPAGVPGAPAAHEDVAMANGGATDSEARDGALAPEASSVPPSFGGEMAGLLAARTTSSARAQALPLLPSM